MGAKMNMGAFSARQAEADPAAMQEAPILPTGSLADRLRGMTPVGAEDTAMTAVMASGVAQDGRPVLPQDALGRPQDDPRTPTHDWQGIQALRAILAKQDARTGRPADPSKGQFVPGVRPTPTGPTAHEIWSDPEQRKALSDIVTQWEAANPGRSFKATHLAAAWNDANPGAHLNNARARTLKAKIDRARNEVMMQQMAGYFGRGAKKAVL